jgi:hypothetical protein
MVRFGTWILLSAMVGVPDAPVERPAKGDPIKPVEGEVHFADGSVIRSVLMQDSIDVMTKYGKLTVPVGDIRRIDFGVHLSEGVRQRVEEAIKNLASDTYRERQEAVKQLIGLGALAYPAVHIASGSSDPEVAKRAHGALKTIREKVPAEHLRTKVDDFILTAEFPITGRIVSPSIKVRTTYFGDVELRLSELRTLRFSGGSGEMDIVVDAAKYGSAPDQWMDTGFKVDEHSRLVITAAGTVDLWPQTPGQYTATPKGYGQPGPGKAGRFSSAALVGRIGENGAPFLIGDRYEGTPGQEGLLFIHIVPSPWNNASTGTYQVKITANGGSLGGR